MVEAIRGTLTGNRETAGALLRRPRCRAAPQRWQLELVPRDPRLRGQVAHVRLNGRAGQVREVQMSSPTATARVMRIEPVGGRGERGVLSSDELPRRWRQPVALDLAGRDGCSAVWLVRPRQLRRRPFGLPALRADAPNSACCSRSCKNGATARVLMIGIRGGTPTERARCVAPAGGGPARQRRVRQRCTTATTAIWQAAGRLLFEHRYLLSPAVDAQRFTVEGLREGIADTVALLGTPAGSAIKPLLWRDPTGETVRMAESLLPGRRAAHGRRRVGVAHASRAPCWWPPPAPTAPTWTAQARAIAAVKQAFAALAAARPAARAVRGRRVERRSRARRSRRRCERLATLGHAGTAGHALAWPSARCARWASRCCRSPAECWPASWR